jgi:chromosome partitioning protein
MYNARLLLTTQVVAELKKHYYEKLFSTAISRGVRLSEAPSYGMPVMYYDKNSKGAEAYARLGMELLGEKYEEKPKKKFSIGIKKKK